MSDSLDLITPITEEEITEIESAEELIQRAIDEDDPSIIFHEISSDKSAIRTKGVKLMHLLYQIRERWEELGYDDRTFGEVIYTETGLSPQTAQKYSRIWEVVFANPDIPEERKRKLYTFPVMALYYLVPAINDGVLEEEHWEAIENSPDKATVRQISRELRGMQTSSATRLTLLIDRHTGDILAARNKEMRVVGFINLYDEHQDVIDAVERIINSSNMLDLGGIS